MAKAEPYGPIDKLAERADTLAGAWAARARTSTTVGRERALLRLFGVGGLDAAGRPLAWAAVDRYLAGGRHELGAAAPVDAGLLLGTGLVLAAGTALAPLLFGADALTSTWFEATVPVLGHIEFVTSTIFDIGVYLVVIGLVLDVLRSLGAEVDRQQEADDDAPAAVTSPVSSADRAAEGKSA